MRVGPVANKSCPYAPIRHDPPAPGRGLSGPSPPALRGANQTTKKKAATALPSLSVPSSTAMVCQGFFALAMCLCVAKLAPHVDFWGELLCSSWNKQAEAGAAVYRRGGPSCCSQVRSSAAAPAVSPYRRVLPGQ